MAGSLCCPPKTTKTLLIGYTPIYNKKFKNNLLYISIYRYAAAAKSLQSCLTLCDPIDSSPPGSPVPGILQARTLEWAAMSFSNARKWKVKVKSLSRVRLLVTPWTAAYQAPPSMGFSRQEYWSGLSFPSPGDLPSLGIEPRSPTLQAENLPTELWGKPSVYVCVCVCV